MAQKGAPIPRYLLIQWGLESEGIDGLRMIEEIAGPRMAGFAYLCAEIVLHRDLSPGSLPLR